MNLEQKLVNFINDSKIKSFILRYRDEYPFKNFLMVTYDTENDNVSFSVKSKVTSLELVEEFYPSVIVSIEPYFDKMLESKLKNKNFFYLGRALEDNSKYVKFWLKGEYRPHPDIDFVPSDYRGSSTICQGVTGKCGLLVNQAITLNDSSVTPFFFHFRSDYMNKKIENEFKVDLSNLSYNGFSISEVNDSRKVVLHEITSPEKEIYNVIKNKSLKAYDICKIFEEILERKITQELSFFNSNKLTLDFKNVFNYLVEKYGLL